MHLPIGRQRPQYRLACWLQVAGNSPDVRSLIAVPKAQHFVQLQRVHPGPVQAFHELPLLGCKTRLDKCVPYSSHMHFVGMPESSLCAQ